MTIEIDHVGLGVSDYEAAKKFYSVALAPLGITLLRDYPSSVTGGEAAGGFGIGTKPFFWLSGGGKANTPPLHLAFRADSRAQVDAFYGAALKAGGKDNGKPGIRKVYHPHYYGAFVLDLDGNNIEAVCHKAEGES